MFGVSKSVATSCCPLRATESEAQKYAFRTQVNQSHSRDQKTQVVVEQASQVLESAMSSEPSLDTAEVAK